MGKFVLKSIVLTALLFALSLSGKAQPDYSFSRFGSSLPTIIEDICQDSQGRIWLASWNGLYRYDGKNFHNYRFKANEIAGTMSHSDRYDRIVSDSFGRVWLLGSNKRLYYFDIRKEEFHQINDSLYKDMIRLGSSDICFIREDNCIQRTKYSEKGAKVELTECSKLDSSVQVNGVYKDFKDNIWIYTDTGIFINKLKASELPGFCCDESGGALYFGSSEGRIVEYIEDELFVFNTGISDDIKIIANAPNTLEYLIGSAESGLWVLNLDKWKTHKIKQQPYVDGEWEYSKDREGNLWLYSRLGSINWYDKEKRSLVPFFNSQLQQNWDSEININSFFIDFQDNIWIGGSWKGLEKATPKSKEFKIKELALGESSPEAKSTRSLLLMNDGRILVSTKDGFVHLLDKEMNEIRKWDAEYPVYDLYQEKNGTLWMASKEGGILEFATEDSPANLRFDYKRHVKDLTFYSPIGNKTYCIQNDHKGKLWFGFFDESLSYMELDDSERRFISKKNRISFPTKYENKIRFIQFNSEGELFTCGWLGIFVCENPQDNAEDLIFTPIKCVENFDIQHLLICNEDEMYASSFGHGFIHLIRKDGEWTSKTYSVNDGLLSNYVFSAIEDREGNIWLATHGGLNKFIPSSGIIISYPHDVLGHNIIFNEGEPVIDNEGIIYFNTNIGILYFNPANISRDSYKPQIYIENCFIDGNRISSDEIYSSEPKISLRRGQSFILEFNSIDMSDPDGVNYSYRIGNRNWIHLGNNPTIRQDKFNPGTHKLEIRSTNAEGYQVNNNITVEIKVKRDILSLLLSCMAALLILAIPIVFLRKRPDMEDMEDVEKDKFTERFNSFIENNLDNASLSVNDIANEFGMSRSALYTKINEVIGQAPAEYIRSIRLNKASELLSSKELSIAQIAYMTGFNDPHYFGKAFKREYGITPSEYRKKNQ